MLSISNLVTEKQAKAYLESLEDFSNTLEMQKEFSINVSLPKNEAGIYQPFMIEGDWMGCVKREKDGNEYVIHYIQVMRKVDGQKLPIMISMYGFSSMHTQLKKHSISVCDTILFKYAGKKPVPNNKDRMFHSCLLTKQDITTNTPAPTPSEVDEKQATMDMYKDTAKAADEMNKLSDDLPF